MLALAPAAAAQVQPYGTDDYGGFRNILPPGQSGFDDLAQAAEFKAAGIYPPHSNDQLGMYSSLATSVPITEAQIPQFYKDATFGVPSGDVASTESPEPGVTIERDSGFGVPHIYGDTRAELMFGIGYATAEDRLFFIDALRHSGQGDLAQFAGGANVGMDESVWANEPYTQQDLTNQINWAAANSPDGPQILSDATNYIDGINAYISKAESPLNALDDAAGRVRRDRTAPGTPAVHGRGPRLDRDARGWDLRQRRRAAAVERGPVREHGAEVRARAVHGGGVARTDPDPASREERRRRSRRPKEEDDRPRRARPTVGYLTRREGRDRRRQACQRPLRLRHVPQLRRSVRPRGADDRPRQVVPVPDASPAEQGGPGHARAARLGLGLVRQPGHGRRRPRGRVRQATTARRPRGSGRALRPACSDSRGRCRTRCWSAAPTAPAATRSRSWGRRSATSAPRS